MSRYLSTFLRLSPSVSRFINWDLSHAFHVKISLVALGLASLHAIGHLTGTFIHGSRPRNEASVAAVFGADSVPRPYVAYVASLPGWTGITALGIFWVILIFSLPPVRRRSYEIFQLVHLLMFPMIGLLIAHGLDALLQFPMLGYWLAFPTLLVTIERVYRFGLGFYHIPAKMDILDGETVCITVTLPKCRIWRYRAGQYILLQVPQVSLFQWHPITISTCLENKIQVHIKTDGNWTQKLRRLGVDRNPQLQYVGIDGPFGAPAQSFYQFDHTLIMGSGIGVTPFSGILTDLQARTTKIRLSGASHASHPAMRASTSQDALETKDRIKAQDEQPPLRTWDTCKTVDFHWIVKDRNHLLWFSDLLNTLSVPRPSNPSGLHIRITTHVTQKRRNITAHVFRYLLETHRTPEHPASPLTGLLNPTHFGRPCLATIMEEHYESMKHLCIKSGGFSMQRKRVGVFFCGAPVIGYELADRCRLLTLRGREDGTRIEYHFSTEVF
jgi:dual oxidase